MIQMESLDRPKNSPEMEENVNIDDEEVVAQISAANIENQGGHIPLTDDMIEKIKVLELKKALL